MIVYVVMYYHCEDTSLLEVFYTKEAAKEYIRNCPMPSLCEVEEMEVK